MQFERKLKRFLVATDSTRNLKNNQLLRTISWILKTRIKGNILILLLKLQKSKDYYNSTSVITETSITDVTSIGSFIHRDNPLRYGDSYLASIK